MSAIRSSCCTAGGILGIAAHKHPDEPDRRLARRMDRPVEERHGPAHEPQPRHLRPRCTADRYRREGDRLGGPDPLAVLQRLDRRPFQFCRQLRPRGQPAQHGSRRDRQDPRRAQDVAGCLRHFGRLAPQERQGARPPGLLRLSRPDRGPRRTRRAGGDPRRGSRRDGRCSVVRPGAVSHRRRHHRRHRRQGSALGGGLLQRSSPATSRARPSG